MDNRNRILIGSIAVVIVSIVVVMFLNPAWNPQPSWVSVVVTISVTTITLGVGTFQILDMARELKTKRVQEQTRPFKISLEIGGEPITIEASDTERVEEILKLAQRLHASPP